LVVEGAHCRGDAFITHQHGDPGGFGVDHPHARLSWFLRRDSAAAPSHRRPLGKSAAALLTELDIVSVQPFARLHAGIDYICVHGCLPER
jgi:hypothetical protein